MSRALFWRLTPRELREEFIAVNSRRKQDFELLVSAAWHVEFFARQKSLKGLDHYLKSHDDSPEVTEYMAEQTLVEDMSFGMLRDEEIP